MALLTLIQQQAIKPISTNWANNVKIASGVTNFQQLELEIEQSKLSGLLGIALFQDVQDNPTEAPNIALLDGSTFENCDGNTIKFKGLRYIIAYLLYAESLYQSSMDSTFTGLVNKSRNETQTANKGDLKTSQDFNIEIALNEFELIKDFLNENATTYPLWIESNSKKMYKPKFTFIKKTIR